MTKELSRNQLREALEKIDAGMFVSIEVREVLFELDYIDRLNQLTDTGRQVLHRSRLSAP